VLAKNGNWRNIYFRETVFKRHANGTPSQLVGIAQDITQKLRAERENRRLNETVTAILQNLPVTLWRFDREGKVLESKGAGLEALRLQENALVGQSFAALHEELDRQITNTLQGNRINTLAEFNIEGEKVYKQVYLFQEATSVEAIGFCLDVTRQMQAQAEARYRTMLLDQLLQHLPLVLAVISPEAKYVEMRGKGLRSVGLQDNELAGKSIYEVFPFLKDNIEDVLSGEIKTFTAAFPYQGRQVYFQNFGFLDRQNNIGIAFGIDITGLKEAQQQLTQEKEFSENLLETHIHGILALDTALTVTTWNRSMEEFTSLDSKAVVGNPIQSLLPRQKSNFLKQLENVLTGKAVTVKEAPFLSPKRNYEITLVPLYGAQRDVTGILGVVRDTTVQLMQQEAETKYQLLRQKAVMDAVLTTQNEERKRIAEALHNSLAQLLYAAKLNLEELKSGGQEKTDAVATVSKITNFLDEAIKETRTLAHELIPRALEDFGLKSAIKDLATKLSTSTFTVQCIIRGFDNPTDHTLETHLFRFTQELLNNVMKHAEATEALVQIVDMGNTIRLRVEDNGKGMPSEKAQSEGYGMGLASIQNRVKLLQGHMQIDTKTAEGTAVTLEIPH
ncbi:MAG: PAS domain S-box protein, partial [Rufibacter sp.]